MTRKEAREFMMKTIFQMDAKNDFDINHQKEYFNDIKLGNQKKYCNDIFSAICENNEEIDREISKYIKNWKIERMAKTDLAILRLAAIEIIFIEDIPDQVAINEAVELSKSYCEDKSPSYINGILGGISGGKHNE